MGRKRLVSRDDDVLVRYCEGFNIKTISEKFHITPSHVHKIIRRAEEEGFQFKRRNPTPWDDARVDQPRLFD